MDESQKFLRENFTVISAIKPIRNFFDTYSRKQIIDPNKLSMACRGINYRISCEISNLASFSS